MKNSKYTRGQLITSLDDLTRCDFISVRDKIYNRGWFKGWQIQYAERLIDNRIVYKAVDAEYIRWHDGAPGKSGQYIIRVKSGALKIAEISEYSGQILPLMEHKFVDKDSVIEWTEYTEKKYNEVIP